MAKRIEISGLNLYYGGFHAVADVSMTIEPRVVTAFIGPSGGGKSTVLRALNRMHELTPGAHVEGSVELDGTDLYGAGVDPVAVRRQVGMVLPRPDLFGSMSIFDNVAAGLRLTGVRDRRRLAEAVERSLRQIYLWNEVKDRLGQAGGSLSGDQQQRLGIARAIAVEPQVLLMDNPCSALDPISVLATEDLILRLREAYTLVIVTPDLRQAARVSDQTAFFGLEAPGRPGRLVEMGPTGKIFANPDVRATEDYIAGRLG